VQKQLFYKKAHSKKGCEKVADKNVPLMAASVLRHRAMLPENDGYRTLDKLNE
jgi:hypothetical protein